VSWKNRWCRKLHFPPEEIIGSGGSNGGGGERAAAPLSLYVRVSLLFICSAKLLINKFVYQEKCQNYWDQMLYFKAKMHQIRYRLGLCPRIRWGAHSAPQALWLDSRSLTSKGKGKKAKKEGEGRGGKRGREKGKEGEEGEERGRYPPWLKSRSATDYIGAQNKNFNFAIKFSQNAGFSARNKRKFSTTTRFSDIFPTAQNLGWTIALSNLPRRHAAPAVSSTLNTGSIIGGVVMGIRGYRRGFSVCNPTITAD